MNNACGSLRAWKSGFIRVIREIRGFLQPILDCVLRAGILERALPKHYLALPHDGLTVELDGLSNCVLWDNLDSHGSTNHQ